MARRRPPRPVLIRRRRRSGRGNRPFVRLGFALPPSGRRLSGLGTSSARTQAYGAAAPSLRAALPRAALRLGLAEASRRRVESPRSLRSGFSLPRARPSQAASAQHRPRRLDARRRHPVVTLCAGAVRWL